MTTPIPAWAMEAAIEVMEADGDLRERLAAILVRNRTNALWEAKRAACLEHCATTNSVGDPLRGQIAKAILALIDREPTKE